MKRTKRTPSGAALTELIPDLFGVSNRLLSAGDTLVADLGLTSARWQVLGTISAAERPQPVAWLARDMGAHRQNVQRIVNDLVKDDLVALSPNQHHRRAPLVKMTEKGMHAFEAAMQLQAPWINGLSKDLTIEDVKTAHKVLKRLRQKLALDGAV